MVIAPPLADLRYPPIRWQTVFVSTRPLVGKSVQNGDRCGICATVWPQLSQFRLHHAASFPQHLATDRGTQANWPHLPGTLTAF